MQNREELRQKGRTMSQKTTSQEGENIIFRKGGGNK